jgi:hypothetical protein
MKRSTDSGGTLTPMVSMFVVVAAATAMGQGDRVAALRKAPVRFCGGHQTDRRDGGRPVVLIAAALGVPTEVFRDAFRGVRPARGGPPSREQVHRNKAVLLKALSRYGITNDRLDEVSDYYRYRPERGELWPTKPASAYAIVENGAVVRFVVTEGGSGYSSLPTITVEGVKGPVPKAKMKFGKTFETNGSVAAIVLSSAPKK